MSDATKLRVLFDVTHPAQVHLFRHAIAALEETGHQTLVASRDVGVTTRLLDAYGIDHRPASVHRASRLFRPPEWAVREYRLARLAGRFEPDVVVSHLDPAAVHAAALADARAIVFADDERATATVGRVTLPFATVVCTPRAFAADLGPKHRRYDGYQELASLHPTRFQPTPEPLEAEGIDPDDPYFVLRFGADRPGVDGGPDGDGGGFSPDARRELVGFLARRGDVFVDADVALPSDLDVDPLPVPPEDVHHLLAFADLYAGDSTTMAVEAGLLGTPSVLASPASVAELPGHVRELDADYGLVLAFETDDAAVVTAKTTANDPMAAERWADRRTDALAGNRDPTAMFVDTIRRQGDGQRRRATAGDGQFEYELA